MNKLSSRTMSARLDDELYREIVENAREKDIPKTRALRELTKEGLKQWRLTNVLALYREGKVTVWKASRIAEIPLAKMVEIAASKKIPIHYKTNDLERDFKSVYGETG